MNLNSNHFIRKNRSIAIWFQNFNRALMLKLVAYDYMVQKERTLYLGGGQYKLIWA
jgi:hypothetical protein